MTLTHYGNTFERIGGQGLAYNRLEALDRLANARKTLVVWHAESQFYKVYWKKVTRHKQKWVKVCSKSGQIIKSNCEGMTEASLDVHLKVLLEFNLNSSPRE